MKMLLKRNLLENITIISNFGTLFCILLHYLTDISLLSGKWLLLYVAAVFVISVFFSFRVIQWLLRLNKPISYDVEGLLEKYPILAPIKGFLPKLPKPVKQEWKEYDTNELSVISTVLERKLVSSWYISYISQDIGFPFACKQMLDQMIGKAFQICSNIEIKDVFVDVCTILTLHLREYEKAVKRHEKSPANTIESFFKTSHPVSDPVKKYTSVDHCTNILRIMIKELLPWELRDTPHSELLVRILSKKLDSYIDSTLANPDWLNDKLLTYLTGEENVEPKEDVKERKSVVTVEEPVQTEVVENTSPKEDVLKVEENKVENVEELLIPEFKEVRSSPVLRQKRGRQGRNEVKIYDRIIEGSVKTWETDMDLQCISLGQDLLASLDGEITLSRLWGQEETESSPELVRKSPQLWTGEEEALEVERCPSPRLPSPNAADALLKDLQSTVSQVQSTVSHAKHKIGDLQVNPLDVYGASDEAAGMMEGLLDFGIAGLKKGLRFTGLSDDSQEKSPSHTRDRSADKSPPLEWGKRPELAEPALAPLGLKEDCNGSHHLVKQHRVTSQDSVPSGLPRAAAESPEPQYEEAADLSTSIAKLRRLLRQRAEAAPHQNRGEEVWWEGAEETRGRTAQARRSSRPVDPAACADEYDMSLERNSPNQTSNNMQRLDRLFQRTVTGVFNSLKTAVAGEEAGAPAPAQPWAYVTTANELSVCVVAARLAWSRRARGVEAALDSLRLQPPAHTPLAPPEDLEEWVSQRARAWCAASELARALRSHVARRLAALLLADVAESLLTSWLEELSRRLRELPFRACEREGARSEREGTKSEREGVRSEREGTKSEREGAKSEREGVRSEREGTKSEREGTKSEREGTKSEREGTKSEREGTRSERDTSVGEREGKPASRSHSRDPARTCRLVLERIPALTVLLGSETATECVARLLDGLGHAALNKDAAYRLLDILALHFKVAAGVRNPAFDNN